MLSTEWIQKNRILFRNHKHYFMSPLLLTCCVLFLAAFCVLAYVIQNWNILRRSFESPTGPRRWGWIQSWSKGWKKIMDPTGDLDRMVRDFKADNAERQKRLDEWRALNAMISEEIKAYGVKKVAEEIKEASDRMRTMDELRKIKNEKFPQHIIDRVKGDSVHEHIIQNRRHARDLYNDGWRCGGGIDQSGRRILFRGEGTAYVSLDVWSEVERLTWANRPLKRWSKEDWDKMDAVFKANPIQFHLGTDQLSERPAVVGEKGKETIVVKDGIMYVPPGSKVIDWSKVKKGDERKRVEEVNEVPDDIDWGKFRTRGIEIDMLGNEHIVDEKVLITYRNAKKRFLPSVNPLGDTAMYTRMMYHSDIFGYRFGYMKFKKGGSRG